MAFANPPGPAPTIQTFFLFADILVIAFPVTFGELIVNGRLCRFPKTHTMRVLAVEKINCSGASPLLTRPAERPIPILQPPEFAGPRLE